MTSEPPANFLPRTRGARIVIGLLALPSFLITTMFLIAMPTVYFPWPPPSIDQALALFAICELLAAGSLFTLLAILWAVATPRWVATLLEPGSRLLIRVAGLFLVTSGIGIGVPVFAAGEICAGVMIAGGFLLGVRLLFVASPEPHPPA